MSQGGELINTGSSSSLGLSSMGLTLSGCGRSLSRAHRHASMDKARPSEYPGTRKRCLAGSASAFSCTCTFTQIGLTRHAHFSMQLLLLSAMLTRLHGMSSRASSSSRHNSPRRVRGEMTTTAT